MKKLVKKANKIGELFIEGALNQLTVDGTMQMVTVVGLYQGLKYNGNLSRGIKAGGATLIVLSCLNGARTVVANRHQI